MGNELTIEEACLNHLFRPEDFSNSCNKDGTRKKTRSQTTITLKDHNTITVNNTAIYSLAFGLIVFVVVLLLFLKRRRNNQ